MPLTASLKMLHDIIQAAMGWEDYHLWELEAGDRRYGLPPQPFQRRSASREPWAAPPSPEWPDNNLAAARNVKLGTLIERGVRELTYTYDMGDNWEHRVIVEAVRPGDVDTKYPRFIDGARRCPPEDIGAMPGYDNFLDAMADPNHEEHANVLEWYGGPYDPDDIDELITKRRVTAIAIRRAAGKAAYAKRRA